MSWTSGRFWLGYRRAATANAAAPSAPERTRTGDAPLCWPLAVALGAAELEAWVWSSWPSPPVEELL